MTVRWKALEEHYPFLDSTIFRRMHFQTFSKKISVLEELTITTGSNGVIKNGLKIW
jgi:hypothetical protein